MEFMHHDSYQLTSFCDMSINVWPVIYGNIFYFLFIFKKIYSLTEGYSGSDLTNLAKDAALGPIRGKPPHRA